MTANAARQRTFGTVPGKLPFAYRLYATGILVVPALASLYAVSDAAVHGVRALDVVLFAGFYVVSTLGITVGYHRLLAHGAFHATPALRSLLAIFGCLAGEGPPLYWVANHRRHHNFSDEPGDPHSPYWVGDQPARGVLGFWHAHAGWMISHEMTNTLRYCPDLVRDQGLARVARHYNLWLLLGLLAPGAIAGAVVPSVTSVVHGVLWGGLIRMFLLHHVTWSINSVTHLWGSRGFELADRSHNVAWLALPSMGESWHNNHHAFPSSAHFGLEWYQVDLGAWAIELFHRVGLASSVRRPTAEMIEKKRTNALLQGAVGSREQHRQKSRTVVSK
jgi:stearoyl-CoA desaturase (delta-9 desaturase)